MSSTLPSTRRKDEIGTLMTSFNLMTESLRKIAHLAEQIASGDLRINVKPQSPQDMLGNAFAKMVVNLREMTAQIAEVINVLTSSTAEIMVSTTQVATSVNETAAAVTETTSTLEEVRQVAEAANQNAKYVSDQSQSNLHTFQTGKKAVEDSLSRMTHIRNQMENISANMMRLNDQSHAIREIISTIDELAEQSNLLALNAAIEAAKAGEHGSGFNVVAQEVRRLAEQSKLATNTVEKIISDIQNASKTATQATEQGSQLVEESLQQSKEAGEAIVSLADSVNGATQASTQIALSSQQQLMGMDQVTIAMQGISEASQQNALAITQVDTAAHNINELGKNLNQIIKQYKV